MRAMTNKTEVDFYKRLIAEFMLQAARVRHTGAYVEDGGAIVFVSGADVEMKIKEFEMEAQRVSRKLLVVMSLPRENEPVNYDTARGGSSTGRWKCCACDRVQDKTTMCVGCQSVDVFPMCPVCKSGVLYDERTTCSDVKCTYKNNEEQSGR